MKIKSWETFIKELSIFRGQFRLDAGRIRCQKGDCPIIAIARAKGVKHPSGFDLTNGNYMLAGKGLKIRLTEQMIRDIVMAADYKISSNTSTRSYWMRRAMLKVLGLKEKK